MKLNFKPFRVGTIFNPIREKFSNIKVASNSISIKFPSRLNAMALDPSKITANKNLVYNPGEIVFMIKTYKDITVKITDRKNEIEISKFSCRQSLIRHAVILMREALDVNDGLYIDVKNDDELKHCGFGSSSSLIAGVAVAINELYGNPIKLDVLARYMAQNHGEEISENDDKLVPVQCIGGSAIGGFFNGGMKVISGETCFIKSMDISNKYKVVIGFPVDFQERDSKEMMDLEIENFDKFLKTGLKFNKQIAYNILHKLLPAMTTGDIDTIGDVIFDYRFNMGSIKNCSFGYPKLTELTDRLADLKRKEFAQVLAISSVGPGIFAITDKPEICKKEFIKNNLIVKIVSIENNKYKVIKNEKL